MHEDGNKIVPHKLHVKKAYFNRIIPKWAGTETRPTARLRIAPVHVFIISDGRGTELHVEVLKPTIIHSDYTNPTANYHHFI